MFQPRNLAPSGPVNNPGNNQNPASNPGTSQNVQNAWVNPAEGNFRATFTGSSKNVSSAPSHAIVVQPTVSFASSGILAQHRNEYNSFTPPAGQTHNTLNAMLPVSTLSTPANGPCAIGPVPKKDILVEGMPAVSLWDSGAPVSIAAGYLRGLLEAKGVDPSTWPIDPPSTSISVANGKFTKLRGFNRLKRFSRRQRKTCASTADR